MNDRRREALLKEYAEVSSNFRLLTDIRFKLLAFLPIATAAATAIKSDSTDFGSFTLSLFGFVVTLGLVTYNARNDQLYDELVGRAAAIERGLGLPDGGFANRPHPWLTMRLGYIDWKVDHRTGVATIYSASIALWLSALLAPVLELGRQTYLDLKFPYFWVSNPPTWVNLIALALAICVTYFGAKSIKRQKQVRADVMRDLAARAVKMALTLDISSAQKDTQFVQLCAELAEKEDDAILARAIFYASIEPESIGYYLPRETREQEASHFVALLTDLPPQWLFDCATNRRSRGMR